jgi:hypothetical protein
MNCCSGHLSIQPLENLLILFMKSIFSGPSCTNVLLSGQPCFRGWILDGASSQPSGPLYVPTLDSREEKYR